MFDGETVLLTGTIKPNENVRKGKWGHQGNINVEDRILDYFFSIQYYVIYSNFNNIIFCENSNYEFGNYAKLLYKMAKQYGKNLEIIQFRGNSTKLLKSYYGYGEGEIINYAIKKSEILLNCKCWYKITGRYVIENINEIIKSNQNVENLFFRLMFNYSFQSICTAFFKTNTNTRKKYLENINDGLKPGISLEGLFYWTLKKTDIYIGNLKIIPHRIGREAEKWQINILHYLLLKIGCWNYDSKIFGFFEMMGAKIRLFKNKIKKFLEY